MEFVGRDKELASLTGEQGGIPGIAVIEGMPGVGKTALAVRAARLVSGQYPDGTLYLNLHSHDTGSPSLDPAEALYHLLQMLSVPAAQIPETVGEHRAVAGPASTAWRNVILDDASGVTNERSCRRDRPGPGICIAARRRLPRPRQPFADPGPPA